MPQDPPQEQAQVEVICPGCGYHLTRTAARLRRETPVICPNCGKKLENGGRTTEDGEPDG